MLKTLFGSVIAVATTIFLSVGASASAAPQHFNLNMPLQCFTKGPTVICASSTGEETVVQAGNGNFSADINGTSSVAVTMNGALLFSGSSAIHEHVLYTGNFTVLQEAGTHETSTFTQGTTTCTFSADVHATNLDPFTGTGHFQYENVSFVCV
jgi:hypothetical protein